MKGPYKNLSLTLTSILCVSLGLVFGLFLFAFIISSMRASKALHDQQYRLETVRDRYFVNKTYNILTSSQYVGRP
jgi:hypothetical protein